MKTNSESFPFMPKRKFMFFIMKTAIFFICITAFGFKVDKGFSQKEKIIIHNNAELSVEQVLDLIADQTNKTFIYNSTLFEQAPKLNVNKGEVQASVLLQRSLSYESFDVKFSKGSIIITKKERPDSAIQRVITGSVKDKDGLPLMGASVLLKENTTIGTQTDFDGNFSLQLPNEKPTLIVSYIGFLRQEIQLGDRTVVEVVLQEDAQSLDEVVIVGYTAQRKKDIIGAVSVVNTENLNDTPSSNIVAQLQGRASGVTVSSTGDPEGQAAIRIRGFSSYGNNNPLYVIDGVPTTDASRLNPQDIESIQILKDASSAAIYGARAANGVIVVTTIKGKANKTTFGYNGYSGVQVIPYKQVPDMMDSYGLIEYLNQTTSAGYTDPVFGAYGSFSIPDRYIVSNDFKGGVPANDPRANPSLSSIEDYGDIYQIFETSEGTDWFRAMSRPSFIQNHQISSTGGSDTSTHSLGLNYFSQEGNFKYTDYQRYTIRMNSSFDVTDFLTIGENFQVAFDERKGDTNLNGEQTAWANSYRSTPFTPVRDINGGWGGSLIGGTSGISTNPVALLSRRKDWNRTSLRTFGNIFGDIKFMDGLNFRSSIGIEASNGQSKQALLQEYERTERRSVTQLTESSFRNFNWTWTNTLTFQKDFGKNYIQFLLGTEAIQNNTRSQQVVVSNFDFETNDFLSLNTGLPGGLNDLIATNPQIFTTSLNSYFGRLDYTLADKYLFNATVRRDASSVFGEENRWGTFPSLGLGWRVSEENFLADVPWVSDFKLRAGWGEIGSISNVPANNQFSFYSSLPAFNFYDITGANTSSTQGFGARAQGNSNTKWETTRTLNIGMDISLFNGKLGAALDVYQKDTEDLLVPSFRNGLEPAIDKPFINLGTMRNTGVDLNISNNGYIAEDFRYGVDLTFTQYKNELTKLNDEDTPLFLNAGRLGNVLLTTKGEAISSFYGYQIDGFYNTQDEVDNGTLINGSPGRVGTWKYMDVNGDNNITLDDRVVLGSPHPDFQMGLNFELYYKNFDFTGFLFWNQGSEIFNYTKYFTYMGVLGGGIAKGKLDGAWTPENPGAAQTPRLGVGAEDGYTSFVTGTPHSFYVEDGSYLRLRTLQIGYTFPELKKLAFVKKFRMYVQAQNVFTITKYSGADPDLGLISGDGTDQYLGVDLSGYPNPRQFLWGINLSF